MAVLLLVIIIIRYWRYIPWARAEHGVAGDWWSRCGRSLGPDSQRQDVSAMVIARRFRGEIVNGHLRQPPRI